MNKHQVNSSTIEYVEFDDSDANQTVFIKFKKRGTYMYSHVPIHVKFALLSAPSVGKFFNENIRGRYVETKLA